MKEQTKVAILLLVVIIVAVASLVFIFYQYSKIQTQFTSRIVSEMLSRPSTLYQYKIKSANAQTFSCEKPDCYFYASYRVGPKIIATGNTDANGKNIKGCHNEGTKITVQPKEGSAMQKLQCISGGWTLVS